MTRSSFAHSAIGLMLVMFFVIGCSVAAPTGAFTGRILGDDGKPIINENIIVALICSSDDSDFECLDGDLWDMDQGVMINSICDADDTSSNCLLHFGQGATTVEADGSYTIANVPPGQHGLLCFWSDFLLRSTALNLSVQADEITKHDFKFDIHAVP